MSDVSLTLKYQLQDDLEVNFTIDDIRLNSILTTNKTIRFTKNSFFYTILDFTQFYSGVLGEFESFVEAILGSYKSDKTFNITGVEKIPF